MKRAILTITAAITLMSTCSGCFWRRQPHPQDAPAHHGAACGRHGQACSQQHYAPGPPTPTYAYPYYTTRAPRDFLVDNPPSIGR